MSTSGKVFLVGAGPGDPELITARGLRRLGAADLVLYDALVHEEILTHVRPGAQLQYVGKRAGRRSERQQDINQRLVQAAQQGQTVVRLKGGDPYLFGRGSEEAEHLTAHGVPFEVVPGVPSPLAATAYAGISLSHRDMASSVAYITATESPEKDSSVHDWPKLATATQTLVIFMGMRKLETLMRLLIDNGRAPDCPAAVIQWASLPRQRTVVGTVSSIAQKAREAGLGLPALTVVGEVVDLREALRWYDNQPLFGKRVLVTRPEAQSAALASALRDQGAQPVPFPAIRIAPAEDGGQALHDAVQRCGDYDWLVFTSVNGVDAFFDELEGQGCDGRRLASARLAAIGPATRDAIARRGLKADCMPQEYRGEAVAEAVKAHHDGHMSCISVLLPRAAVARDALPAMLREAGAKVDVVAAYRSLPPEPAQARGLRERVDAGELDVVTFTSPSTVQQTLIALGEGAVERLNRSTVAVIGPITGEAARDAGLRVDVSAQEYTVDGLVSAVRAHFEEPA